MATAQANAGYEMFTFMREGWEGAYPAHHLVVPSFVDTPEGQEKAREVLEKALLLGAKDAVILNMQNRVSVAAIFEDGNLALDMGNEGTLSPLGCGQMGEYLPRVGILKIFAAAVTAMGIKGYGPNTGPFYAGKSAWAQPAPRV